MEPSPGGDRNWLWIVLAFVAAWTLYLIVFGPRQRGDDSFEDGQPADYDWAVETLGGEATDLATFRGKAVFLNVWATWCPPCVGEMPSIARLSADPRLKDVAFVCVSVDGSAEPVRQFVREKALTMTVMRAIGPIPEVFATDGIPATFLIAPDGRVMSRVVGGDDWDRPDVVSKLVDLAKGSAPPVGG